MHTQKNTYIKLDRDSAKSRVDNASMFDCRNMKFMGNKPNESGARTNDYGNKLIVTGLPNYPNDVIIGSKQLRNFTILFSVDKTSTSDTPSGTIVARIWKLTISPPITASFTLLYNGALGLSTYYPITEIVTRYENDNIQKIYWADNYNVLRFANVAKYLTVSGNAYSISNPYLDSDIFNLVSKITFSTPLFSKMTNGNISVGMVQYAYKLFRKNGVETIFSPVSQFIHLTTKQEGINSLFYQGSDRNDEDGNPLSSGKGIRMSISGLDTLYDKVEIVAIHYSAINEAPTINVVDIFDIPTGVLYFVDDGVYGKGSYTPSQFALLSSPIVPKTLATKNNILFAGNIKQTQFDVTYDARAYRWTHALKGKYSQIWDKDGSGYYSNVYNAVPRENDKWISYNMTPAVVLSHMSNIPATFDCINPHNNIAAAASPYYNDTKFKYQKDYTTIGGQGPNVLYTFSLVDISLDSIGTTNKKTFVEPGTTEPYYYASYASPQLAGKAKSYARDEVYRFGVVFYSLKGEESPVHWIGDIRMPSESDFEYINVSTTYVQAKAIKVIFTLYNLPTTISGFQIVRVKREKADRSIVFQGILNWMRNYDNIYYPMGNGEGSMNKYMTDSAYTQNWMFAFSPELSFNKEFSLVSGDYIEALGVFKTNNLETDAETRFTSTKLSNFVSVEKSSTKNPIKLIYEAELLTASTTPDDDYVDISKATFVYRKTMINKVSTNKILGDLGTCVMLKIDPAFVFSSANGFPTHSTDKYYVLVNYRRPVIQYGGPNYEDRLNNEYIKASDFVKRTASTLSIDSTFGDVTIGYTDILQSFYNKTIAETSNDSAGSVVMFPCESTINQSLRMDDCYHRIYLTTPQCFYLRETGNLEFTPDVITYTPNWSNLYLYNSVYSKESDIKKYFQLPEDYDFTTLNNNIVMASNVKINNEEIDSWSKFSASESIEINGDHGKINYLRVWNNQLLYWQDNAVGTLAVFDRSMIQDNDGKKLILGEGGILSRYDEIVTNIGCSTITSLVITQKGVYWYDNKRKRFYRLSGSVENLGLVKGMNSYFDAIPLAVGNKNNVYNDFYGTTPAGFFMLANSKSDEIWFNIKSSFTTGETLVYDELNDNFSYFIDHDKAVGFIVHDNSIISQKRYSELYWEQSESANRCELYGVYKDSYVDLIICPTPNIVCTFNGFELTTEILNNSGTHMHAEHLTSLRVQNDYQDTGTITLSATNLRRLLRTWRINAIRDSVSPYARIRDTYIKVRLSYTNDSNNYKVMLYDLLTLFDVPSEAITNKTQGNEK